jgi:hypothetical protein
MPLVKSTDATAVETVWLEMKVNPLDSVVQVGAEDPLDLKT